MADVKRQPLKDANKTVSRLPLPGSKIARPGSKLPMPSTTKRARSPDPEPTAKRAKVAPGAICKPAAKPKTAVMTRQPTTATSQTATKRVTTATTSRTAPVVGMRRQTSSSSSISSKSTASTNRQSSKPVTTKPAGTTSLVSKRPGWDLKGRLQDMEKMLSQMANERATLEANMESNVERISQLESNNQHLETAVVEKERQTDLKTRDVQELESKLRDKEEELRNSSRDFRHQIEDLEFTKGSLQRQKESIEGELKASRTEVTGLKSTVAQLTSAQEGIKAELSATKVSLDQSVATGQQMSEEIAQLKALVARHETTIEEYQAAAREHETTRRQLHNTIQELKGNIRVFCRMRPLLGDELVGSDGTISHIDFPDESTICLEKPQTGALDESTMSKKTNFNFDRVFSPDTTQSTVFEEISQLVQSALDGYNVCIFAYGQTGSGKTYTMEGPDEVTEENEGMIPRAVGQVFQTGKSLEEKGWMYEYEASFVEIYNETIRDLLGNGKDDVKHDIKLTGSNSADVMVTNLTNVTVKSEGKVAHLLKKASDNRAVAETKCNERSSRSHSVFRLKITGQNEITGEGCQGTLNLIDLAGSERLKDSGSTGARLKETQAINKSLSTLGQVIMALANKEAHVPYRNSKLTYLLQNSLGGNSKTLMFVNISPKEENYNETVNSLRFATKVNQCNIGTATKKVK